VSDKRLAEEGDEVDAIAARNCSSRAVGQLQQAHGGDERARPRPAPPSTA
jgi:hypothetical protein